MTTRINKLALTADEVVVRIDQGDYLQERGGYDWGRSNEYEATASRNPAEAQAAIDRLRCPAAEIEAAPNS